MSYNQQRNDEPIGLFAELDPAGYYWAILIGNDNAPSEHMLHEDVSQKIVSFYQILSISL